MRPVVKLYKLGRSSYQKALSAQQTLFDCLKRNVSQRDESHSHAVDRDTRRDASRWPPVMNSLILVEHEPVYTIGLRTQHYDNDYVSKLQHTLSDLNLKADIFKTTRGGLITFHGPGQLVAYPILHLGAFSKALGGKSVKAYVKNLENVIIDTLSRVGLHGAHTVKEYPGVWLDNGERKIAFIGISCKRFITMHGISINCDCDLSWFDHIVSCGIENKTITSVRCELLSGYEKDNSDQARHFKSPESISDITDHDKPFETFNTSHCDRGAPKDAATTMLLCNESNVVFRSQDTNSHSPFGVHRIAKQFCVSFSNLFDCDLEEERFPWELVNRIAKDDRRIY